MRKNAMATLTDVDAVETTISRYWWVFVLRGLAAIAFGVMAFAWPGITLAALVLFFGAYALVDGAFLIGGAIANWSLLEHRWLTLLQGVLGVFIGLLTFHAPAITALGLLIYIAAWSLVTGVLEIVAAIELRKEIEGEWWLLLSGFASILFAMLLMFFPAAGALGLLWVIGSYAVIFGILLTGLGFKLLGRRRALHQAEKGTYVGGREGLAGRPT
jgi:uncharacterized membrane protein HdeD (DUF308 family)